MKLCIFGDAQSVHLQQLAPRLVDAGAMVHVVTHKPASLPGATVERFKVPPPSLTNPRRWWARSRAYLRCFLRDFDVVNVHFLADWGFCRADGSGLDAEEVASACFVASAWGSDVVDPPGETPACAGLVETRRAMLQAASLVTTCGPRFAEIVAGYANLSDDAIVVAPFGVDLDLFAAGQSSGGSARPDVVGFFKGFRPVYGPRCLVRAIPRVLSKMPATRFHFVVYGAQLAECKTLANDLAVGDAVQWSPRTPHDQLPFILKNWTLSIIPSIHEAFGVAALESSAMGVPVVASDVCGLRDTVQQDVTGLLVPPQDSGRLGDAVTALLTDPTRRARMATAGRAMVESHFDWRDLARHWIRVYDTARQRRLIMV